MALSPIEALLRIQGERQDVQKALAPSMYQVGKKMKKKGRKAAWGAKIGEHALPFLADLGIKTALNLIAPGMGSLYAAAKKVPVLKAAGKGTLAAYGHKLGGEFAAGQVGVPDTEKLMKKYLGETASGTQAMRFGRGAVESIEGQKGLQLEALQESIRSGATTAGLKTAGQSLLGDLSKARKTRILKDTGEVPTGGGPYDVLSDIRKGEGSLTAGDYLTAMQEGAGEDIKSLFDISPIQEELGKGRLFQTGREARRMAADFGDIEQWYSGDHKVQEMPGLDEWTAGDTRPTRLKGPRPFEMDTTGIEFGQVEPGFQLAEESRALKTGMPGYKPKYDIPSEPWASPTALSDLAGRPELAMEQVGLGRPRPEGEYFGRKPLDIMSDQFIGGDTTGQAGIYGQSLFPEGRTPEWRTKALEELNIPPMPSEETFATANQSMQNLGLFGGPMPTPEQLDPSIAQARPIFATSRGALDIMGGDTPYKKSIGYGKLMETLGESQMKRAEGLSNVRGMSMYDFSPMFKRQSNLTGTGFLPNLGGNWRGY